MVGAAISAMLLVPPTWTQQLNENCTVSALNRNAAVRPDGTWRLDNIPTGLPTRVTATCNNNGTTQSGRSQPVSTTAGVSTGVLPFGVSAGTAIPETLTLTSPTTSLSGPGATVQLTVNALYPGGSTANVTAAATGTTYTTSNPAIATVSPEGLVTAVSVGTVLVQAINDGAQAIIQLGVAVTVTDSDQDGLPDAFELQNGLNPSNPVDASEDADNDGLTNLEEFRIGTNLRNADTDGDGISDRVEVRLGLRPTVADATTIIQGRVVDGTGAAVVGATVSVVQYFSTVTDSTGNFRLLSVPANLGALTVWAVVIRNGQMNQGSANIAAATAGGVTDAGTITLALNTGTVTGVVTNVLNQPVPGAQVTMTFGPTTRGTLADAAGRYRVDNVPFVRGLGAPIDNVVVTAVDSRNGEMGQVSQSNFFMPSFAVIDVRVRASGTVSGTIYRSDGVTPISGAQVLARVQVQCCFFPSVFSDSQGRYTLAGLPAGSVAIDVTDFSTGQFARQTVEVAAGVTRTANFVFPGTGQVNVTVRNAAGSPVNNALVSLNSLTPYQGTTSGRTSATGTLALAGVMAGTFSVVATDPVTGLSGRVDGSVTSGGSTGLEITVQGVEPGTVRGVVTFSNGQPVPFPNVFLLQADSSGQTQTIFADSVDAEGRYLFTGAGAGPFTVTAQSDTGLTASANGAVTNPAVLVEINLTLPLAGSVTGTVRDAGGNPVDATVAISGQSLAFDVFGETDPNSPVNGVYRVDGVPTGPFRVQAEDSSGSLTSSVGTIGTPNETATANLTLPATTGLTITVRAADGVTPVANSGTRLDNFEHVGPLGHWTRSGSKTNSSGVLQFTGFIPVGQLDVAAAEAGKFVDSQPPVSLGVTPATLTAGTPASVTVVLGTGVSTMISAEISGADLTGADNFRYTVDCGGQLLGGGTVDRRLTDAYSPAYGVFDENGAALMRCTPYARPEASGRQLAIGSWNYFWLRASRKVFVPAAGGYARYLDVLTNPTSLPITVPVAISGTLVSGGDTRVYVAPSNTGNAYAVTDASLVCCSPALGHVFAGPGATVPVSAARFASGDGTFSYLWTVTVQPGQTVILMHFAIQRDAVDPAAARVQAEALVNLTDPNALAGMTAAEKSQVVNFRIP